jgi:predicted 2-oxoglutarate/Fe(II)-dependent dioxygenase YbiX
MDAGHAEPADVLHAGIEHNDEVRRATYVDVSVDTLLDIEEQLDASRDRIAAFFDVPLISREGPGFLRYRDGDFYRPHRDRAEVPSWPGAASRSIAAVVFLNSSREAEDGGDFDGGVLRLLEGPATDVVPMQGTLVAFPAGLLHEVSIVRNGIRDAIVDWYYERS